MTGRWYVCPGVRAKGIGAHPNMCLQRPVDTCLLLAVYL